MAFKGVSQPRQWKRKPRKIVDPDKKIDFVMMRHEFFTSHHIELAPFLREKKIPITNWIRTKTSGWSKEKSIWHADMIERALTKIQEKEVNLNAEALSAIMAALRKKLTVENIKTLSISDLERLWEIFMTMNGRITKITQNKREDHQEVIFNFTEDAKRRRDKYLIAKQDKEQLDSEATTVTVIDNETK